MKASISNVSGPATRMLLRLVPPLPLLAVCAHPGYVSLAAVDHTFMSVDHKYHVSVFHVASIKMLIVGNHEAILRMRLAVRIASWYLDLA